jgi:hypothetical protein
VTVTLEISGLGSWGDNCTVDQVWKQAKDDARGVIHSIIVEAAKNGHRIRVIGEPEASAVIYPEKNR